jgi:hypothetical protein
MDDREVNDTPSDPGNGQAGPGSGLQSGAGAGAVEVAVGQAVATYAPPSWPC